MPDEQRFPELARSLRSLGAARDAAGEAAHDAVFTALLEARRRAAEAHGTDAVALIRGAKLADAIERAVVEAATAGVKHAAAGRARAASACERLEPLRASLVALDARAVEVLDPGAGAAAWDGWVAQLRRVFATADEACVALTTMLSAPIDDVEPARWFRPRGR